MVDDKRENSEDPLTGTDALRWGRPPLALLPERLAGRLKTVRLPGWLAEQLDSPGASALSLTADAWNHLSSDESVRERASGYVLDLVATHAPELHGVPIGDLAAGSLESLGLGRWPARARGALLRFDVSQDPGRLATLTFGEVLDVRGIGVRTALETAALLELFLARDWPGLVGATHHDFVAPGSSAVAVPRWGEPHSPLLPQTLRRAFADEVLPEWLLQDLHLPPDATALALDTSVWRHLDDLPLRVEHFLLGLVTSHAMDLAEVPIIDGSWPPNVRPEEVAWPARVYNALLRAHLLDPDRLERLTYGDLLDLRNVGVKSAFEFAAIADTLSTPARALVLDERMRRDLTEAAEEDWAHRVRPGDPRFRDIVPPYLGSLNLLFDEAINNPEGPRAHALAKALPSIRTRAQEVASEPIDVALMRLLRSLGTSDRNVAIVATRFGWTAGGPHTLQEVANKFSLTRERVRQIADRAVGRVGTWYMPQIERAVQLIADHAPITTHDAAHLLVDEGLSTVPIEPVSLKAAAELLGYDLTFHIDPGEGVPYVLAKGLAGTGPVFLVARREAGRVGVSNIAEIQAELETKADAFTVEAVERILRSSTKIEFLDDDWFWMPDIPADRNRLRNVTQRMLSVTPRLDVPTLRQGVRRRYRFIQIDLVPPVNVLTAFYAAHPEFAVRDDATVGPSGALDYRDVLGDVEQVFVEVLRGAPTGLMDRAELEEAVTSRGVNPSTFSVFTSYSPILDHPAMNVWCLRGHSIDPAQLEALRAVVATRSRRRRTLAHGWDEDGSLWLTVLVGNVSSPVIGIPASIARYVADRRFPAKTQEGTSAGVVAIDDRGTSWGYGPFMRRRGAEPGDALTLRFDLAAEEVTLSLGDEASLDEG